MAANVTMLTFSDIARNAADILNEEMPFCTRVNRAREEEFSTTNNGYKAGDTVTVKVPPVSTVYSTATFADGGTIETYTEQSVSVTLDTRKHVGLTYSAQEMQLEMSEFRERVLRPQVRSLSATVEADLVLRASKLTPNYVGTAGSTPTTAKTYYQARQKLQQYLAPPGDRTLLMSSEANVELIDASKALFNPVPSISKMYSEGLVLGKFAGCETFECVNLTPYGNGADIVMTVNGASQTGSTLTVSGNTAVTKGQKFTIAGVFAVHPLTGVATTTLQQFTITADSSAATISISPPITPTMPNKTVSASPADTTALTFVGSASTNYARSLMFHRDAFTVAFAPLPVIASCEGYTATIDGMSVRVMKGGDFTADKESTRIDVLYGIAGVRPLHSCEILQ